ncbi:hypothetical protein A2165_04435, partial [Candidatus Curtissbacteria bacterium RBG_13_40_7]
LHKKIIPRAGGVPIYLSFIICALLLVGFSKPLFGIILGGLILVCIGIIDDRFDLGYFWKFLAQIAAGVTVVLSGIGIVFITNPLHILGLDSFSQNEIIRLDTLRIVFDFFGTHSILVISGIFALFWIIWVINMVNFSSGVDGQMPGIVLVTLFILFAASLRFAGDPSQLTATKLTVIGMGATLGFLVFNFYPAKIFPGDSGPYFLGFLVAVLSILSGAKVGTAILVMAVPLIDGVYTVIRRVASGKSPFLGDKKHLHHRLLELGWGQRRIALFYWTLCAILGAAALSLNSAGKLFAGLVMAIIILGGLTWLDMNLPQKAQK